MRFKYWMTGMLLISILLLVFITPNSFASNYDRTFSSQVQFGLVSHELFVSVPSSLYDYYNGKTHRIRYDREYATFVTPDAFQSVAENIWNLTCDKPRSDEEFANTVLHLVHQIPYADGDLKYPIETLVENSGKCDTLSLLAASIIKAGGLDVVLLYYKEVHHINVGVYLPYEPHVSWWWLSPTGYEFNGKKYWIAECTPATEWKIGEVPPLLANTQPWIISLENSEESSPAQVSAKLDSPLTPSSISINLSSDLLNVSDSARYERTLTISGSISPTYPNKSITVYLSQDRISYNAARTNAFRTETDDLGKYSFSWNLTSPGTYYIKTSWSGTSDYAGADSETLTVFIGFPKSLIQFEGTTYNYDYGHPAIAIHELHVRQGVKDFLDLTLSGTGVLLTGDFIIVQSGQSITISREGTTSVPLENIVIEKGEQPLRLPDDMEQTTNNKFGLILRNSGGNNYSVAVRGMNDYDMVQINKHSENRTTFINASKGIKENTWYKVVAKISEDEVTAEVHDTNGTLLESIATTDDATRTNELVMLIANNTDRAVAFKNLRVETLDEPAQPAPESEEKAAKESDSTAPHAALAILLATTIAALVYKKRKSFSRQKRNENYTNNISTLDWLQPTHRRAGFYEAIAQVNARYNLDFSLQIRGVIVFRALVLLKNRSVTDNTSKLLYSFCCYTIKN